MFVGNAVVMHQDPLVSIPPSCALGHRVPWVRGVNQCWEVGVIWIILKETCVLAREHKI